MIATPVAAGTRSSVRHEPSDNADTAIPEAPSGREPITPATLPPRDVRHLTAAARPPAISQTMISTPAVAGVTQL
jgi:hypothetical protein